MNVPFVNLKREAFLIEEEVRTATWDVISSGNYILGKNVLLFEERFADYCGCNEAISLGNGSDGLTFILKAIGIGAEDEVICPANSFIASAWSIIAAGGKPIFCDVENDFLISRRTIEKCLTKKTKVIMAVNLSGKLCDLEDLNRFCEDKGLILIEDSAQAVGAVNASGNKAGNIGYAAAFSLHPLKILSVYGDGGVVTTNSVSLAGKIRLLRNHGLVNRDESRIWGFNSRLDEIQAAYALIKLKHLEKWIGKYISIAKRYSEEISDTIIKPTTTTGYRDVFHNYILTVESKYRNIIMEKLNDLGVETKVHYPIPLHLQKCASGLNYKEGDIPNVERLSKSMISLPIYHTLTSEEVDYVISSVNESLNSI